MLESERSVETRSGYFGDVVCGEVRCDVEMCGGGVDFDDDGVCSCMLEKRGRYVDVALEVGDDPGE